MSGEVDHEDKTEEPTEKRLHDAIERGQIAFSREAPLFASLSAALIASSSSFPDVCSGLLAGLIGVIDDPAGWRIERGADALALAGPLVGAAAEFLLPIVVLLMAAGVVASIAQGSPRIAPDRILPDFSRISPRGRLPPHVRRARRRGVRQDRDQARRGGHRRRNDAARAEGRSPDRDGRRSRAPCPSASIGLAVKTIAAVLAATLAVASADLVWSRILWRRDNRMSRHEVKEELRQAEGDRMVKARLRSLRLDRSRRRMLSAVPRATMVVVNPTHYAVAMRYVRSEGGAPIVLAKGVDLVALKIRAIAEAHDIPVIEDRPLARSLYSAAEVERPIPAEFYRAVAEIVHLVQQRKAGWANRNP